MIKLDRYVDPHWKKEQCDNVAFVNPYIWHRWKFTKCPFYCVKYPFLITASPVPCMFQHPCALVHVILPMYPCWFVLVHMSLSMLAYPYVLLHMPLPKCPCLPTINHVPLFAMCIYPYLCALAHVPLPKCPSPCAQVPLLSFLCTHLNVT